MIASASAQYGCHIESRPRGRSLRNHITAALGLCVALVLVGCSGESSPGQVDNSAPAGKPAVGETSDAYRLWSDGITTLGRHGAGEVIPKAEWAPAIRELDPWRVYVHKVDIVIVLEESQARESGKYIVSGLSSRLLQQGDGGFIFSPDPEDQRAAGQSEVYDFARAK